MTTGRLTPIYLVIDHDLLMLSEPRGAVEAVLSAGARLIQYRAKDRGRRVAFETALELRRMTKSAGAALIINDDTDLALAIGADGVHLGQEDLPAAVGRRLIGKGRLLGVSAHTVAQAVAAERDGADYLGVGPVYLSATKRARPPLGCSGLSEICGKVSIPVYAIGGIQADTVENVLKAGAFGAAAVSAVFGSSDFAAATRKLIESATRSRHRA